MRLGVFGPVQGVLPALARDAQRLLDEGHADEVIHAAEGDALGRAIEGWTRRLAGASPGEGALLEQATRRAAAAPEAIGSLAASEQARPRRRRWTSEGRGDACERRGGGAGGGRLVRRGIQAEGAR